MKISVLTENYASQYFTAEHGLSYFIEHDNKKILFDTGATDVFIKNAEKLKLNLNETDAIVLSHGHWDHGNGLKFLNFSGKPLICHPDVFMKRYQKNTNKYIGINSDFDELSTKFHLVQTKIPYPISENIIFLGEIPRLNSFEAQTTSFKNDAGNDDFVPDDSALAVTIKDELVVISACSHSGICNITEYAKKVTGLSKVKLVIGGFHLKKNDFQTKETIKYFKKNMVKHILPSHCTQLPALAAFYDAFKIEQVKSGMVFNL